ncbi:MAG: hypothetical protein H7335_10945 [Massilia sp.]|nr:hypothetical protein [Massilia sp.]
MNDFNSKTEARLFTGGASASARLNDSCHCVSLDLHALHAALASELGIAELVTLVEERCPFLFAARPVFISAEHTSRMEEVVRAVESVIALPAYRAHVLSSAPPIARHDPGGPRGVFLGYDFHLRGDDIGLIEINTNAGGAMLNAVMARAHRACSLNTEQLATAAAAGAIFEDRIADMFREEWARAGRTAPLKTIAIVDTDPSQQYLYAEFLLFQRLFERHGIHALISDPSGLTLKDGMLMCGDTVIDLVYNRLTDFMLAEPSSVAVREAYLQGAIVLTPHPQAHALYADKRNLAVLGDDSRLKSMGVPDEVRSILRTHLLPTRAVVRADAEQLWSARRQLFFKPRAGYGSRAAYRGDKLTKRVWEEILNGDYVAQALMAPGERSIRGQPNPTSLKFDLRVYAYAGASQWIAARVYQGQTTNFRTPEGGFAPVYSLPVAV